jgi:hypothetical protein
VTFSEPVAAVKPSNQLGPDKASDTCASEEADTKGSLRQVFVELIDESSSQEPVTTSASISNFDLRWSAVLRQMAVDRSALATLS